jgi:hypothetical protein
MRICFIFVLAFGATPCVHARQPQIDELTNNVVEELIKTHEKAVVVFDFVGPDKNPPRSVRKLPMIFAMLSRNQPPLLMSSILLRSLKLWKQIAFLPRSFASPNWNSGSGKN